LPTDELISLNFGFTESNTNIPLVIIQDTIDFSGDYTIKIFREGNSWKLDSSVIGPHISLFEKTTNEIIGTSMPYFSMNIKNTAGSEVDVDTVFSSILLNPLNAILPQTIEEQTTSTEPSTPTITTEEIVVNETEELFLGEQEGLCGLTGGIELQAFSLADFCDCGDNRQYDEIEGCIDAPTSNTFTGPLAIGIYAVIVLMMGTGLIIVFRRKK